jgi:hypothetical protein
VRVSMSRGLGSAAFVFVAISFPAQARAASTVPKTATVASCNWERPGHDPFIGDVVGAVDRYGDIAPELRARLKARMAKRDYDDLVIIRRDSITGKAKYGSTIHDMHFGTRRLCHSVTRESWTPSMQERGLVYCDSGQCILVPTVCRNVSRITRAEVGPEHANALGFAGAPGGAVPGGIGSTALAMDERPSFVAPGDIRAPLSVDGPVGAQVATSEEGAGTTTLPPGGPFAAGYYATLQIGSAGAVLSPAAPATQTLPPSAPPTGGTGRDVPPPVGITPFVITPVPEPQTWALMLSGLAVLTWLRRRARASMARMKDAWTAGSWFEGQLVVERHG